MSTPTRRGFFGALGSLFKENHTPMRPPYASLAATFDECQSCEGMCVSACEENIIYRDKSGTPFLDFKISGCSDCHKCLEVCVPKVLSDPEQFLQGYAKISMLSCMSHHETICFACKEPCMDNAIVFKGMFNPIILPDRCTGCGYCISLCPSEAIKIVA